MLERKLTEVLKTLSKLPCCSQKTPCRGPCQSHPKENSLGGHMGNSFTCDKTHCRHSADNKLESFSTSTLFLMSVLSVWRVWKEMGQVKAEELAGWKWLQERHDVSPTLLGAWKYERYFAFQHIQMCFHSGMVFKSSSMFHVLVDKCSLLWFRRKHKQPTSKRCVETQVWTAFSKLTLDLLQVTEAETYWPFSAVLSPFTLDGCFSRTRACSAEHHTRSAPFPETLTPATDLLSMSSCPLQHTHACHEDWA